MVDLAPILLWLSFGIQYLYLLDHFLIFVANLFAVIHVHFNLWTAQETRLGLVYLQIPHSCSIFYNLSSLYFSMLVYPVVKHFGLHIAT